jgi:tol-pal system protein YbgF
MRVFFIVVFVFGLSSCAQRLDDIEARLDQIDDRAKVLESRSGLPVGSDYELLESRRIADVRTQLLGMRNEVTVLQGKVEALEFDNQSQRNELRRALSDYDLKISSFEKKIESLELSRSQDTTATDYERALKEHQNGKFREARERFSQFIKANPDHSLADNALYWMGESFMIEGDYRRALVQFQDLVDKFPQSDKKCDAMDQQVKAFEALKMTKEAKAYSDLRTQECRSR